MQATKITLNASKLHMWEMFAQAKAILYLDTLCETKDFELECKSGICGGLKVTKSNDLTVPGNWKNSRPNLRPHWC